MNRPVQNPFFKHDPFVVAKGRCISDALEATTAARRAANRKVYFGYGKICPGCDKRYGATRDGFIDIERCPAPSCRKKHTWLNQRAKKEVPGL